MRKSKGFTLIELMITVAIVAILASLVLPSYTEYIRRAKITEATAALAGMRVKLEQYFQDNRSYALACTAGVAPQPADTGNFQYSCPTLNGTNYLIQAAGINSMNGFKYTIDQANVRTTVDVPPGWDGAGKTCWVLRKDGSC